MSLEIEDNVSTFMDVIRTVQTIHRNDMDQIQLNISTILADLTQINTSLTSSTSNIAAFVQSELSSVRNHSITLAQNISAITGQVSLLIKKIFQCGYISSDLLDSCRVFHLYIPEQFLVA